VTVVGNSSVDTRFDVDCKKENAASRTSVSGSLNLTRTLASGQSNGRSENVQNEVVEIVFDGAIEATGTMTRSYRLQSGKGSVSGSVTLEAVFNGRHGTVSGTFSGNVKDSVGAFSLQAQGEGDLDGLLFKIDFTGPVGGPFSYSGVVLNANQQG
jgi:hypothetical protein